jgi:hypothetical protein
MGVFYKSVKALTQVLPTLGNFAAPASLDVKDDGE